MSDVTYYAVIHGARGSQRFDAMRERPVGSREVFTFQGPALTSDDELRAYFEARFLPLEIVCTCNSGDSLWGTTSTYENARILADSSAQRETGVRIRTREGHILWPRPLERIRAAVAQCKDVLSAGILRTLVDMLLPANAARLPVTKRNELVAALWAAVTSGVIAIDRTTAREELAEVVGGSAELARVIGE